MATFYRFQGRETLDTHSYCEFLADIWFELGGHNKEVSWHDLKDDVKEELLDDLSYKWDIIADIWLEEHQRELEPLLPQIKDDALETVIGLVDTYTDLSDLVDLQFKFPLPGVFAIEENGQSLDYLFSRSKRSDMGLHNNYLLTLESDDWIDLEDYGCLVFDAKCLTVKPVPEEFHKPAYKKSC